MFPKICENLEEFPSPQGHETKLGWSQTYIEKYQMCAKKANMHLKNYQTCANFVSTFLQKLENYQMYAKCVYPNVWKLKTKALH